MAEKHGHRVSKAGTVKVVLLLLFINRQLRISRQLPADNLDTFHPGSRTGYTAREDQPLQSPGLGGCESSGDSATPAVAENVVARPVPKLKSMEQVVQLGQEEAFLSEGLISRSLAQMGGSGTADLVIEHHGGPELVPQAAVRKKILMASACTAVKYNQPRRVAR